MAADMDLDADRYGSAMVSAGHGSSASVALAEDLVGEVREFGERLVGLAGKAVGAVEATIKDHLVDFQLNCFLLELLTPSCRSDTKEIRGGSNATGFSQQRNDQTFPGR